MEKKYLCVKCYRRPRTSYASRCLDCLAMEKRDKYKKGLWRPKAPSPERRVIYRRTYHAMRQWREETGHRWPSDGCVHCGSHRCLTIHHVSSAVDEWAQVVILCRRCHRRLVCGSTDAADIRTSVAQHVMSLEPWGLPQWARDSLTP